MACRGETAGKLSFEPRDERRLLTARGIDDETAL
jgi:hypothetical protein